MKGLLFVYLLFIVCTSTAQVAVIGKPLPAWQPGYMDLHHINTGRGNAAFYVFPDGTTMLLDAGELDPTNPRTVSRRNTPQVPDGTKHPYEWIADYIIQVGPQQQKTVIDYAIITHFHDDHFGGWYPAAPLSASGKFVLTGITGVASLLPVYTLVTRDYNFPVPVNIALQNVADTHYVKTITNYLSFLQDRKENKLSNQFLKAGSRQQFFLKYQPKNYPGFYVQNIKSNGAIWTGQDSTTAEHFPPINSADKSTWPDENTLSNVVVIHYNNFSYYTGGDCPGNIFLGDAAWRDVETPVAKVVGEVDVATMDHHGNRDAVNEVQVKTFKPFVWIEQVWTADHPGHETLIRATSPLLYSGNRDLFATNMMQANKDVIGPLVDRAYKSTQGHIVVRILPGGEKYYVIILDDSTRTRLVKQVFGPYTSKPNKQLSH